MKKEDHFRPLIVTKSNPKKAYFKDINMKKRGGSKIKRYRSGPLSVRGNSWAGSSSGQRVVVKINPVKNRNRHTSFGFKARTSVGSSASNLRVHISYISRSGAGEDGQKAVLFSKENERIDAKDFYHMCKEDRHHFRMIISPENGYEIVDFKMYVRDVMRRVEADLSTKVTWVAAIHYDTDDAHAHVIIRGKNDQDQDLVIGRDYIASGIRMRAQEIATELLGERSLEQIQKSIERQVDALRITSLDRFIERNLDDEMVLDVREKNNFGKSPHYEGMIKGRLAHLQQIGLADQNPPGVFRLQDNYTRVLQNVAERNDVLKKLYGRIEQRELEDLNLYSIKSGEGKELEGFIKDSGFVDEISDRKYIVMEDLSGEAHYIPIGDNPHYEEIVEGALVRIKPGQKSTGKADFNINYMAVKNHGIYDVNIHRSYVEKEQTYIEKSEIQGYLDSHMKRLRTLEEHGIVENINEGCFRIPADLIDRGKEVTAAINEKENKRFYPKLDILSAEPLGELIHAEKKTWLDRELYKNGMGKRGVQKYNDDILSFLEQRKAWLIERDLAFIQTNGEFALRDSTLQRLDTIEFKKTGEQLSQAVNRPFVMREIVEGEEYAYVGYIQLGSGMHAAVISQEDQLHLVSINWKPNYERGEVVIFKSSKLGKQLGTHSIQRHQEQQKQQSRELDRSDDD